MLRMLMTLFFEKHFFERVCVGLDERCEVVACGAGPTATGAHVRAVAQEGPHLFPDTAMNDGA